MKKIIFIQLRLLFIQLFRITKYTLILLVFSTTTSIIIGLSVENINTENFSIIFQLLTIMAIIIGGTISYYFNNFKDNFTYYFFYNRGLSKNFLIITAIVSYSLLLIGSILIQNYIWSKILIE